MPPVVDHPVQKATIENLLGGKKNTIFSFIWRRVRHEK
jgi:hypothetical protein